MGQGVKTVFPGSAAGVICCLLWACTVAAQINYHDQAFPPQSSLTSVPIEPDGFRIEHVAGVVNSESEVRVDPAVEIVSPVRFSSLRADTVDGVIFTIWANKPRFSPGDTLSVRYCIRNRTMGTVLYDFNSGCQFDVQVTGSRGSRVYSFLEKQTCSSQPSRITLRPSTETVMEFPIIPLTIRFADTLKVSAQMAGYPLSTVQLLLPYTAASGISEPVYLEGGKAGKPVVTFNKDTKMLVIRIDRAQRLTVSAFVLTGKKVNKLSTEKFFAPGTHLISFNNRKLSNGVVIFKVEGNGFSESKIINLAR
ncbi:MAG: hypothetical protein JXA71_03210 [Chitinispirillaceae bacterium]|nr:hypothetical protein [Chitinispirillaceae bacterium]